MRLPTLTSNSASIAGNFCRRGSQWLLSCGLLLGIATGAATLALPVGAKPARSISRGAKSTEAARAQQLADRAAKLSKDTHASARQAIALYEEALQIWESLGDRASQVPVLLRLGNVHYLLSENEQTLLYGERALEISRELQQPISEAYALNTIGNAYLHLEDARKALVLRHV